MRKGLEDKLYIQCDDCFDDIINGEKWYKDYSKIYCLAHNDDNLIYDDILDEYYCHDHIMKIHKWQPVDI